jgi:hypothetical protein
MMQSVGGVRVIGNSASVPAQQSSITQMVIDGTQGTTLVLLIAPISTMLKARQLHM